MPKFYPPPELNVHVRFFCSVSTETISSLHVLSNPNHHTNCLNWYEQTKSQLNPDLLLRIQSFGHKYADFSFIMDLADFLASEEVADRSIPNDFNLIISKIKNMPLNDFAYVCLGGALAGDHSKFFSALNAPTSAIQLLPEEVFLFISQETAAYFLQNIATERAQLISILEEYYFSYFEKCWNALSEFYYGKIILEKKLFYGQRPIDYILSLHKDLLYKDHAIIMRKETDLFLEEDHIREVRIFFSMFTYPHFAANVYEDTISIYKNLILPPDFQEAEEVARCMKVFSDVTRLSMIKLLMYQSFTNKDLAQLLNVAPASISQHLNLLKEMNILTATREKNSINYHISQNKIQKKLNSLCFFLEMPTDFTS